MGMVTGMVAKPSAATQNHQMLKIQISHQKTKQKPLKNGRFHHLPASRCPQPHGPACPPTPLLAQLPPQPATRPSPGAAAVARPPVPPPLSPGRPRPAAKRCGPSRRCGGGRLKAGHRGRGCAKQGWGCWTPHWRIARWGPCMPQLPAVHCRAPSGGAQAKLRPRMPLGQNCPPCPPRGPKCQKCPALGARKQNCPPSLALGAMGATRWGGAGPQAKG